MNKLLPFLALLPLLTGCKQLGISRGGGSASHDLYIGAGQSNMANMNLDTVMADLQNPNARALNVAVGGTFLSYWTQGGKGYKNLVETMKNQGSMGYPTRAILFWQGEAEGLSSTESAQWDRRFLAMTRQVSVDTGMSPRFIVVRISQCRSGVDWDSIREQQSRLAGPNISMVSSDGVACGPDSLHYTQAGYTELAGRIAEAIKGE